MSEKPGPPVKCLECDKLIIYTDKKLKIGDRTVFEKIDADTKAPHVCKKPTKGWTPKKLTFFVEMRWETYVNDSSDLKKTYRMSREGFVGDDPQKLFDECEAQIIKKIGRDHPQGVTHKEK